MMGTKSSPRLVDFGLSVWDDDQLPHFLLTWPLTQVLTASLTIILATIWFWKSRHEEDENYPPSLPALPLLGSFPFMTLPMYGPHLHAERTFRKYGPIYSAWFADRLVVNLGGYDVIREALVNQAVAFAGRPNEFMQVPHINKPPKIMTGIVERSYSLEWKRDRKISLGILRQFGFGKSLMESRILDEVQGLISHVRDLKGAPYDPRETLRISVGNVICAVLLGKRYHLNDCAELRSVIRDIDIVLYRAITLFPLYFLPALGYIPYFRRREQEYVASQDRMKRYLRAAITEHEQSYYPGKEDDFVSAFIGQMGNSSDYKENLVDILRDLLLGGTETTSTTLQWVILYMGNYPDIQTKVQEEIEREVGKGRTVTLNDKGRLPYTEAVLKEVERISVILPITPPHITLSDVTLEGYSIPKDTLVMVHLWSVLRDPKIWPEPGRFMPERFLDKQGCLVHRPELISFSLGRRSCVGEVMARQELFLFFCGMMQNFTFRVPGDVEKLDETGSTDVVARTPASFKIIAEPRA